MSSQVPATNFVSKYILNILFLNILFLNIKVVQILLSIVHDHPVHNLFDIITLKIITFYKTTKEEIASISDPLPFPSINCKYTLHNKLSIT